MTSAESGGDVFVVVDRDGLGSRPYQALVGALVGGALGGVLRGRSRPV
jgi:hypothetical protein